MTPNGDSDADIAARAKQGNRAAFDLLVKRYKDPIYRFIRRYVGQTDDAYDVLQNAFLAAWGGISRYDPERPFLPWLRVIALNKCRDFSRRQTVRRIFLKAFANERVVERAPIDDPVPETNADDAARLVALDRAIAGLPAIYKEPLLLTLVSGLSHQEAAKVLGISGKAVEMRLYRARRKIQEALKPGTREG